MIDFARVGAASRYLTEAEFDEVWAALGKAIRVTALARRRHNIAVLALRARFRDGLQTTAQLGPHCLVGEKPW